MYDWAMELSISYTDCNRDQCPMNERCTMEDRTCTIKKNFLEEIAIQIASVYPPETMASTVNTIRSSLLVIPLCEQLLHMKMLDYACKDPITKVGYFESVRGIIRDLNKLFTDMDNQLDSTLRRELIRSRIALTNKRRDQLANPIPGTGVGVGTTAYYDMVMKYGKASPEDTPAMRQVNPAAVLLDQ